MSTRSHINLGGHIFGKLTVIYWEGNAKWLCWCSCGKLTSVLTASLRKGVTQSCGCGARTHGLSRTRDKDRTLNTKSKAYPDYGARGITICERWKNDFFAFYTDLGPRPKATSLDRIDNDSSYSCGKCDDCKTHGWKMNCRWSSSKQQCNNRRSSVFIHARGKTQTLTQWSEELGIAVQTLWSKIHNLGMTPEAAVEKSFDRLSA